MGKEKSLVNDKQKETTLKVEQWPIERCVAYARNPRKNDEQVDRMAAAIREFGFRIPIVAKSDGTVVDGHLRLKAAKKLGLDTVPVALADELTETQVKAFRLLANQSANWAEWDNDLLKLELDDLKLADFDIDMIGFDAEDLAELFPEEAPEYLTDPDAVPSVQEEPVTRTGDIWLLGKHRLMCGDSTDAGTVALLMDGEKADMVFTDPPYGVCYEGGLNDKKKELIKNDDLTDNKLYEMLYCVFQNIKLNTINKAAIYIFYATKTTKEFINALSNTGLKQRSIIVWHKTGGGFGDFMAHYMNAYEPCIYASNGDSVNWYGANNETTLWTIDKEKKCDLHPTMKPVELVSRAINNSSKEGDLILDAFGGSGSTLIACEKTNRRCNMLELSPHYVDVIVKRWQDFTGQQATLDGDGRTFDEIAQERIGEE